MRKTEYKNISYEPENKLYRVVVKRNGKTLLNKNFKRFHEALAARNKAIEEYIRTVQDSA